MKSYEEYKAWMVENKQKMLVGICFILVFFVGFGTGKFDSSNPRQQKNYTTNFKSQPTAKMAASTTPVGDGQVAGMATTTAAAAGGSCPVKGTSSKIYHVPGGAFYNNLKNPRCFANEADAIAAGYVKSKR